MITQIELSHEVVMTNRKSNEKLHIFSSGNFTQGFFDFLRRHQFDLDEHVLFQYRRRKPFEGLAHLDAIYCHSFFSPLANLKLLLRMFRAKNIIIHCLSSPVLLLYLLAFPSLRAKSYWAIWGKDLYFYQVLDKPGIHHRAYEFLRRRVIKRLPHIITFNGGDYRLAQTLYGAKGTRHSCFLYPSNVFKEVAKAPPEPDLTVILLGNSADPSNNHLDLMQMLEPYRHLNLEIITPLAYGDSNHAEKVIEEGKRLFGSRFKPLTNLLPSSQYNQLLARVDIGVFGHKRQQAMGNIVSLLGMGKKVYIRTDITSHRLLQDNGIKTFDLNEFEPSPIDDDIAEHNVLAIKTTFSEENLRTQWQELFAKMSNQRKSMNQSTSSESLT
ncbi:TDP-N-acetylfucosamine:lipid II N-acetylfucosaminyltransferase [Pseudomaricurvus alkylphenolicus]|uniref:TDP-N-acetylfucosamine:lipid II N-acetylfucosaminyltransferase n=1 Tax=Pseudomaricurvus alkylphenolicus TaxID=1306991 RepID=UPI00141E0CE6|nr:TDP-N-acetylfucosamine:lipid II N-acetylfucosaminyltransferase [Pseudomaricurvus alkylphenolicus]NIB40026.1 TDP-N-acetylfucosamine:lipid II N-acetylfucosaminyltransferase [Pseudomaricurvus alkylphenolicus]